MNRLTKKIGVDIKTNKDIYNYNNSNQIDVLTKLGQLEDVEKELGIDLITLFKALNKKLASLYKSNDGKWKVKPLLSNNVYTPKEFCDLALTREELEQ